MPLLDCADGVAEHAQPFVELLVREHERRQEPHAVAEEPRADEHEAVLRCVADVVQARGTKNVACMRRFWSMGKTRR